MRGYDGNPLSCIKGSTRMRFDHDPCGVCVQTVEKTHYHIENVRLRKRFKSTLAFFFNNICENTVLQ